MIDQTKKTISSNFIVSPGGSLRGEFQVPGDKSISHRALLLSAIAEGQTDIHGFLPGEDTLATATALQAMGVAIDQHSATELTVHGVGLHGLQSPEQPLDLGNSGTATRLMAGLLSGAGIRCELIGDASLMTRPMNRIVEPLQQMGADITASESGTLPIKITRTRQLQGIDYHCPVASAQLKSCLLLAGLYASGNTIVHEPAQTRDHTERMLTGFGVELTSGHSKVSIHGGQRLQATNCAIPGDISSAAFFIVGALIANASDIVITQVGVNPTRDAVITILKNMGANITLTHQSVVNGEPVANIHVQSSQLTGIEIPTELVPIAIDELPIVMVAAACAEGKTTLRGAKELRVKESDRIRAMVEGLTALGIEVEEFDDGMQVNGGTLHGGTVDSFTDHRIAMSFAIAGLVAEGPIEIKDCENVATSFPNFVELAQQAGLKLTVVNR